VNAAPHELLLNHELALRCKIENWCSFLATTRRSNRSKDQKLRKSSHAEE
jgi:hypothetical protein